MFNDKNIKNVESAAQRFLYFTINNSGSCSFSITYPPIFAIVFIIESKNLDCKGITNYIY